MKKTLPGPTGHVALEKGLALLTAILRDNGRTRLVALAQGLHLSRSTLYRMVGALDDRGMIMRLGGGFYAAGVPLLAQLQGLNVRAQMARVARPALQKLAQACGATAHLGVLEQDMVTYLVKAAPAKMQAGLDIFSRENAQLEAYCSGIGKVLLAGLPPAQLATYLAGGPFVALTPQTITDPAALQAHLSQVRAQGFARDNAEIEPGLTCLAVPVPCEDACPDMAISVSFPGAAWQAAAQMRHLERLRHCAAWIGARIKPAILCGSDAIHADGAALD